MAQATTLCIPRLIQGVFLGLCLLVSVSQQARAANCAADYNAARNNHSGFYNAPIYPSKAAFTALRADGSISAWGLNTSGGSNAPTDSGYTLISSNRTAFAAIKTDGSISAWGLANDGGSGAPTDTGYISISSTERAFAAIKADGSISVWGLASDGGSGAPTDTGYTSIASTRTAFAAMKTDGSISVWGNSSRGGSGAPTDAGYTSIRATERAFSAIAADGSISVWGDSNYGNSGVPTDAGYVSISSTQRAFAAMKVDGSISAWGNSSFGSSGAPTDTGYTSISSGDRAFAAMKADGSITTWGNATWGGGSDAPTDTGYVSISVASSAFAALNADGTITAWGVGSTGGSGAPTDSGYTSINSAMWAFAALKPDGTISAWGSSGSGGSGAPTDTGYTSISSTEQAFAAIKADGSISVWGTANNGGSSTSTNNSTGAPTDSGYVSINNRSVSGEASDCPGAATGSATTSITLSGTPDTNVGSNNTYSFTPVVDNAASGGSISFTIANTPLWASFNTNTGALTGTPNSADLGTADNITINVTDGSTSDSLPPFSITVFSTNTTPTVDTALSDVDTNEDALFSFTVPSNTFTDSDSGDTLTISVSGLPAWLAFDSGAEVLSGTPTQNNVGSQTITVRATDSDGAFVENSMLIMINNVNDVPIVANALSDQTTNEDAPFSFAVPSTTFTDEDTGDSLTLTAIDLPAWLSFDAATGNVSGTPSNNEVGTETVAIRATDSSGAFIQNNFVLTIDNINDAPIVAVALSDQATNEDAPFIFTIPSSTFSDLDVADTLTISISDLPGWLSFDESTHILSGIPSQSSVGTHTIIVRATDGGSAFVEDTMTISVNNVNDEPTVEMAVVDQNIDEDSVFSFTVPTDTFTDEDTGDSLTFTAIDLPEWLSFDAATGTFSGTPSNTQVGSVTVTIQATDSSGALIQNSFELTIDNVNDKPQVSVALSDQVTDEDAFFSFTIPSSTFTDPDVGDVLTLSVFNLPDWLSFDPASSRLLGTAEQAEVGTYTITVQAADEGGLFVQDNFTLIVVGINNQSPVFTSASTVDVAENESAELHTVQAYDLDTGDEVDFTLGGDDAAQFVLDESSGALSLPQALDFEAPRDANADGEYRLSVTARDLVGHTTTQSLRVNVTNVNEAPIVITRSLQIDEFAVPDTLIGTLRAQDPEGSELRWRLVDQASPFELTESGVLTVAAALDFETAPAYDLNVQADDGSLNTVASVRVLVIDAFAEQAAILLRIEQDDEEVAQIRAEGGAVSVIAQITNPVPELAVSYDWSSSNELIIDRTENTLVIEDVLVFLPTGLSESDDVVARVSVTRDGVSSEATITIPVAVSGTDAQQTVDSDGDGITDVFEGELGAAVGAVPTNKLQSVRGDDLAYVIESEPGTFLRLGSVARAANVDQSRISLENLAAYLPEESTDVTTGLLLGSDAQSVREVFDFEVANLSAVGESVRVVLPLLDPIVAGDQYMSFQSLTGWREFVSDSANGIRSAPAIAGIAGQCPSPGDADWIEGLVEGNTCIELRIQDGGVNDADSYDEQGNPTATLGLNGSVKDTGGVVSSRTTRTGLIRASTRSGAWAGAWLLTMLAGFLSYRFLGYHRNTMLNENT